MLDIIKDRLSVICALVFGTGGGWCMASIITAPELKVRLVAISVVVSLVISILISVSLKGKLKSITDYRERAIKKAWWLSGGFILSIIIFFLVYDRYTIGVPEPGDQGKVDTVVIVRGLYHTPKSIKYANTLFIKNKQYPDDNLLLNDYGYEVAQVWDDTSLSSARLLLLALYSLLITLLTAAITYGTEIIQYDNGMKPKGSP